MTATRAAPRAASRAVLGIDAAWTVRNPSGVALAADDGAGWRLVAVASSYAAFHRQAGVDRPGLEPDAAALLASARALCGRTVDLVAVDMPLSYAPITGRRVSDNLVSSAYGARKCGTHTPSAERPGPVSDALRAGFAAQGFRLCTTAAARPGLMPGLIEVYPHPALIELTGAPCRLPYKAGKTRTYWPDEDRAGRTARLLGTWAGLVGHLDAVIAGVAAALPVPPAPSKAFEDALDAVVCAFVAVRVLDGRACPLGDGQSAIWVPC